jgi:N-methylhydantoinase B
LRVLRYELREDSGGAGKWRGGSGAVREICFLDNGGASVEGEGHKFRPWGSWGGRDGATAELVLRRATGELIALPSKVPHMSMYFGDVFICVGPSGGGYGDPLERDPEAVQQDVINGFVSPESAGREYGVGISTAGVVDWPATMALRTTAAGRRQAGARGH